MTEKHHARAGSNRVIKKIQHLRGILHRARQSNFFHDDAVALCFQFPWRISAAVFLIGHQNFVALFHINSIGDVIVGLGGVAHHGDLFAAASDECGQRIAEFIPRGVTPDGIVLGIFVVHFFCFVVAIEHGLQHGRGTRANCASVQIHFIFGNQKLFADLCPVRIRVTLE